jgi:hypothetical protein
MKLALTLALLCLAMVGSAGTPINRDFYEKLERFNEHYCKFYRAVHGCPKGAAFLDDCKPELGTFDYYEFNHAASAARPLFSLEKEK